MSRRTHYEVLGLNPGASAPEIKAAFRRRAKEWHPDRNRSPNAAARFREINDAYRCLIDPSARRDYDAALRLRPNRGGRVKAPLDDLLAEWDAQLSLDADKLVNFFALVEFWWRRRSSRH